MRQVIYISCEHNHFHTLITKWPFDFIISFRICTQKSNGSLCFVRTTIDSVAILNCTQSKREKKKTIKRAKRIERQKKCYITRGKKCRQQFHPLNDLTPLFHTGSLCLFAIAQQYLCYLNWYRWIMKHKQEWRLEHNNSREKKNQSEKKRKHAVQRIPKPWPMKCSAQRTERKSGTLCSH